MSSPRDRVLADIRRSLRRNGPLADSVREGLERRLEARRVNLKPGYGEPPADRFVAKVEAVNGIVTRVRSFSEVSAAVEAHVRKWALSFSLVVAPDPELEDIAWSNRFSVERRAARDEDQTSVTGAFVGIGETGTLVLLSSPRSPTTLNFLPEDHLIVLRESRIVAHIEDAWARLREEVGAMPRTVNLITGPSKTADVEQTMQEGAHGPRRLHVILVEQA